MSIYKYILIGLIIGVIGFFIYQYINITSYETFLQPYNSLFDFKDDKDSIYKKDVEKLEKIFKEYNKKDLPSNYLNKFSKFPDILEFPLNKPIQNIILKLIRDITKESDLEIFQKMYNIYYNDDISGNRDLIFDLNINVKEKGLFHTLTIYITILNIKQYMTDSGSFLNIDTIPNDSVLIHNISIVKKELIEVPFKPILSNNDSSIYQIYNKLHLMDPFLTSGKNMEITKDMFNEFDKELKSRFVKSQSEEGTCFDSSKSTNIKEKCLELGGTWDVYPKLDEECPFYKSNKNYPNTFGKLYDKKCEIPLNMKLLGYKIYSPDPQHKPLCYNCKENKIGKGSLGFCCDDQTTNNYKNLDSPDYAFQNDSEIRKSYEDNFRLKNLQIE